MNLLLNKIKYILSLKHKREILFLIFLLLIGMFMEIIGIGIIIPVLSVVTNPDYILKFEIFRKTYQFFGIEGNDNLINFTLFLFAFVYLIKTSYLVLLSFLQNQFLANFSYDISNKLFKTYFNQPYFFHLNNNSSDLVKNLTAEISYLVSFLKSLIAIITESALVLAVILTVIIIDPFGAISIILFFLILSFSFYHFTKRKITIWGKEREKEDKKILRIFIEGFSAIKEIKIFRKESFYEEKLKKATKVKANIYTKQNTINLVPRHYLELITVFGLVILITILINKSNDLENLVNVLGVCLAVTLRIIPSINRIISSIQNMRFHIPSVEIIYDEFRNLNQYPFSNKKKDKEIKFENFIDLKNLTFRYKKAGKIILDKITLKINKGSTIGIIGKSGEGKSTLANIRIGLFNPSDGNIKVDRRLINNSNIKSWQENIGYVPQEIFLTDDTIINNIAFGVSEDEVSLNNVLTSVEESQLMSFIDSLLNGLNTKVGERGVQLSGGQRQRIGIARALYNEPDILVLDEATSSLDVSTEKEVMKSINYLKRKKTIIIISHRYSALEGCDFIYKISSGKLNRINRSELKVDYS